jgi:hypothetical protein
MIDKFCDVDVILKTCYRGYNYDNDMLSFLFLFSPLSTRRYFSHPYRNPTEVILQYRNHFRLVPVSDVEGRSSVIEIRLLEEKGPI